MQPFVINRHDRLVFPSNFLPDLDFSVIETEEQLDQVIRRDFETKAPSGTEIGLRIEQGKYKDRVALMRDVALNLFWVNRFAMTMYEKVPTRWRDVPRSRGDVFLPVVVPWLDKESKVSAVENAYNELPSGGDPDTEDRVWKLLFDVFGNRKHHASALEAIRPTVAQALSDPTQLTFQLGTFDPDYPTFSYTDIVDVQEDVAELEALHRWAMVLHNQYPWDRADVRLTAVGDLADDDVVVLFKPKNTEVIRFLDKVTKGAPRPSTGTRVASFAPEVVTKQPIRPYPAVDVRKQFKVMPKIAALAVVKGEILCSNDDLIRNTAYCWSPMTADEISDKTGIETRMYTSRGLDEMALDAATAALEKSGRAPEEIGAVIFCSCTNHRSMPSMATWLSGQLGMFQTHMSADITAACAGLPYGLSEAIRLLQEVNRPVLLVCGEKFSDKIGTVRPSRMIFGDGAAAFVIAPAEEGEEPDIDLMQTYAGGPVSQVNSIIWPNAAFDNNITVFGPEVKALAGRYLEQMITELGAEPDPLGNKDSAWDTVELVVPHQANKTMVIGLAEKAGLSPDLIYFNIERAGNTSAASIPIAIADAVADGVIDRKMKIFAPGFGAGSVGGYTIMNIDPAVVVTDSKINIKVAPDDGQSGETGSDSVSTAFGG
ncbi:MAG: 3-oxoacyl-[acyl-carrier-protein] synthase III C-terminal domain-containing protein [Nakamurella sp.]